MGLELVLLLVR
jgi:hypothetical protein